MDILFYLLIILFFIGILSIYIIIKMDSILTSRKNLDDDKNSELNKL